MELLNLEELKQAHNAAKKVLNQNKVLFKFLAAVEKIGSLGQYATELQGQFNREQENLANLKKVVEAEKAKLAEHKRSLADYTERAKKAEARCKSAEAEALQLAEKNEKSQKELDQLDALVEDKRVMLEQLQSLIGGNAGK